MTISVADAALDMEKKAIKRCTRRNPFRSWPVWLFCVMFLTSSAGFYVVRCTSMFNDYLLSQVELRNGTYTFDSWLKRPFSLMYKIHVFNYTNVDKFEAGEDDRLHVQDLGPYIYAETLNRVNVKMHENGTVTFQEKRSFKWVGGRPDSDVVVMPNVPLILASAFSRNVNFAARMLINAFVIRPLNEPPFISETVGGFLWGYDTKLFELAKPYMMFKGDLSMDKFGLLAMRNGISKDRITIHTGSQDINKLGIITQINGKDNRKIWGDQRCDKIEGTDGSMFPPNVIKNKSEPIYVYSKDICRTLPFDFVGQETIFDMPTLRYKINPNAFNYSEQNDCFCTRGYGNSRICPPAGLFNITACNDNIPLLTSFPHFYGGDKSLLKLVDGLNPRQEDHESFLNLHPRLAMPIAGWSKLQMNIEVRKALGMSVLKTLRDDMILPLIWFGSGVDELPDSVIDVIHSSHFTANTVEMMLQWCTLIIMILSFSALIACFWKYRAEQDTDILRKSQSVQNRLLT